MTLQITTLHDASIRARVSSAMGDYGTDLRADSRQSHDPTTASPALIRDYAERLARDIDDQARRERRRLPTDYAEGLRLDAIDAVASGLRLRADDRDWIRDPAARLDAGETWYGRDALTARTGIVLPVQSPRVVSETIPGLPVEPWAESALVERLSEHGHVALVRPGQTELPVVGVGVAENERKIHAFGCQTIMPWMAEIAAGRASFNPLEQNAAAARRVHDDFAEQLLVHGPDALSSGQPAPRGVDVLGLAQIPVPQFVFAFDYSGTVTMDNAFADLTAFIATASARREVGGTSTLVIGSRLYRKIMGTSNFSSGGSASGSEIFSALSGLPTVVQQRFVNAGISAVAVAPSLEGFRLGADYDGAVLLPNANSEALRALVALTVAPVYEYAGPHGRSTYWVQRHGGIGVRDEAGVVVGVAKVR